MEAYSNLVEVGYSTWDINITFIEGKQDGPSSYLAEDKVRIVMPPHAAASLCKLLGGMVAGWKKEFGERFGKEFEGFDIKEENTEEN